MIYMKIIESNKDPILAKMLNAAGLILFVKLMTTHNIKNTNHKK